MNLVASAPTWLIALLAAAFAAAAIEDAIRLRISNVTCLVVLVAAIVAMALQGFPARAVAEPGRVCGAARGRHSGFRERQGRRREIKLLACLGLWVNLSAALWLVASIFLAGGVIALIYLAVGVVRRSRRRDDGKRLGQGQIPWPRDRSRSRTDLRGPAWRHGAETRTAQSIFRPTAGLRAAGLQRRRRGCDSRAKGSGHAQTPVSWLAVRDARFAANRGTGSSAAAHCRGRRPSRRFQRLDRHRSSGWAGRQPQSLGGGNTILVQVGDVTDRAPDSLKIIRNLIQLQKEARRSGGRVVTLVGNHEAMNMLGDLRYTTPGEFAAFANSGSAARRGALYQEYHTQIETVYRAINPKMTPDAIEEAWIKVTPLGWVEQRAAWKPDGELGSWARSNPAVIKIGDTVFVHGGISAEYSKISIDEINRRVAAALTAVDDSDKSILNDQLGPLWYRGLAGRGPEAEAGRAAARQLRDRPSTRKSTLCSKPMAPSDWSSVTRRALRASSSARTASSNASIPESRVSTAVR